MNTKATEEKPKLYQFYLGGNLQKSLERYIQENYTPNTRVQSATIRKAIADFLEKEGYYESGKE